MHLRCRHISSQIQAVMIIAFCGFNMLLNAQNLLNNPGFENGLTDWGYNSAGSASVNNTYCDSYNGLMNSGGSLYQEVYNVNEGCTYTLDFNAYRHFVGSGWTWISLTAYDSDSGSWVSLDDHGMNIDAGSWESYTLQLVAPSGTDIIQVWAGCGSGGAFRIDCLDLQESCAPTCSNASNLIVDIISGDDDAEEYSSGSMTLTSSDLEMVYNSGGNQHVGLRFQNISIPQNATITSARIEFEADETDWEETNLTISGQDISNAPAFSSSYYNISSRTKTTAQVPWYFVGSWDSVGEKHMTPELYTIVQEIVDRSDWSSGNDIAFILEGYGKRVARSYDYSASDAPRLYIDYCLGASSCTTSLLANTGFESGTTSWTLQSNCSISSDANTGTNALVAIGGTGGPGQNISATPGTVYALEVSAKASGSESTVIGLKYYDSSWTELSAKYIEVTSTSYETYYVSSEAPSNTAYVQALGWKNSGTGTAYFDDFCLDVWSVTTPSCSNLSCDVLPSYDDYVFALDTEGGQTYWMEYDRLDVILCDNGNGTLTIEGNIINGRDASWGSDQADPCGSNDGWYLDLVLSDMQNWTEFQGSYVVDSACPDAYLDLEYWDVSGTLTGIGCNTGRQINISGPAPGYRVQIGMGGNSHNCGFGMSTWFSGTENGSPVNSDIYANLSESCYNSLNPIEICGNGIDDDADGYIDDRDLDCMDACTNMIENSDFENVPSSFTFGYTFEGVPAQRVDANTYFATNWVAATNSSNKYWVLNDVNDIVNNTNGSIFAYLDGQFDCAQLCGNPNNSCDVENVLSNTWQDGHTYQFCYDAAAWNENISSNSPTGPGSQTGSQTLVDIELASGFIQDGLINLYSSDNFSVLNWRTNCVTFTYDSNDPVISLYLSQEGSGGMVVDNVRMMDITSCGAFSEICGNGIDDDFDGMIDCVDGGCSGGSNCEPLAAAFGGPCGSRVTDGLVAYYTFDEGSGNTVNDFSGFGVPLNLTIDNTSNINWTSGGLEIQSATIIESATAATKISNAISNSNEITLEAWVQPGNSSQSGPARIMTVSQNSSNRNFTLGQDGSNYDARLRTTNTSNNGTPSVSANPLFTSSLQHVVYTWDATSDVERLYIDGQEEYAGYRYGSSTNWNSSYFFAIGNELSQDRPWLGEIKLAAVYDKALSYTEIQTNYLEGSECAGNTSTSNCDAGVSMDYYGASCTNDALSLDIPDSGNVNETIIEVVYKGCDPGSSITLNSSIGNITLSEVVVSGGSSSVYLYRATVSSGMTNLTYNSQCNGCGPSNGLQSIVAYVERNVNTATTYETQLTEISGYCDIETVILAIPGGTEVRDINLALPFSEITDDGRYLTVSASDNTGSASASATIYGSDSSLGSCCLNIVELTLQDVPANASYITVEIITDGANNPSGSSCGQSWVMSGTIFTEISCPCTEVFASAGADDINCESSGTGVQLNGSATGGLAPITYSWSPTDGLDNPNIANPTANPSVTTDYTLTVTSDDGCTSTDEVSVSVEGVVITDVTYVDPNNSPDFNNGEITITANGTDLEYSIDGGANYQSSNIFTGLSDGDYVIAVRISNTACSEVYAGGAPIGLRPVILGASSDPCASRVTDGLLVLYNFDEGSGSTVFDVSGVGSALNLTIANTSNTSWTSGGLDIQSSTIIESSSAATKITNAISSSDEITVEAWLQPDNSSQTGPARIITLSENTSNRNFTFGQDGSNYAMRLRTSSTSNNGLPTVTANPLSTSSLQHVVYTWDGSTDQEKLYIDGQEEYSGTRSGTISNWNSSYYFAIANELSGGREWLGEIKLAAVYEKALSLTEVQANYSEGSECEMASENWTCEDGIIMDYYGASCTGTGVTLNIPDVSSITETTLELVYKGCDPGSNITVSTSIGNVQLSEINISGGSSDVYLYRGTVTGGLTSISYTSECSGCGPSNGLQSVVAYVKRTGSGSKAYAVQVVEANGYCDIESINLAIPTSTQARDINVILPLSEITDDGRYLTVTAADNSGTSTANTTIYGSDSSLGSCCLNIIDLELQNVPASSTIITIDIITNGANNPSGSSCGQSWVLSGTVTAELDCPCTAITANGGGDATTCEDAGTGVQLNGSSSGGVAPVTYSWSPTDGLSDPNIANPTANPTATTTYTLTASSADGCTSTDDVIVTVEGIVITDVVFVNPNNAPDYNNGQITITAVGSNLEYSINGGSTYQTSNVFSNLSEGDYNVSVRHSTSGCEEFYGASPVSLRPPFSGCFPGTISTPSVTCPSNDVGLIGSAISPYPMCNNISNPEFDNGTSGWELYTQSGSNATLSIDATSQISGTNSAYVDISSASGTIWHIELANPGHSLSSSDLYRVSFQAKASSTRTMEVSLQLRQSPWTTYWSEYITLENYNQTYVFDDIDPGVDVSNVGLMFKLGESSADVWVDEVMFGSSDCGPYSIQYEWQMRVDNGSGWESWTTISGATAETYDPGTITVPTQFRRRSYIDVCSVWEETDPVEVEPCPSQFLCDSKYYQTLEISGESWLYKIETQPTVSITPVMNLTQAGVIDGINSTVFNKFDGYIYTLNMTSPYRLYRIGSDNAVQYMGDVTGFDSGAFINAADVDGSGNIIYRSPSNADYYELDMTTMTVTEVCDMPTWSNSANNIGDFAFNPLDGRYYGTRDNTNILFAFDLPGCDTTIVNTDVTFNGANGAFFVSADGFGYGYENNTGNFRRINLSTGETELIGQGSPTSQTDGCGCDGLKLLKEVSVDTAYCCSIMTYTFTIYNNWTSALNNISFGDTLNNNLIWASEPYNSSGLTIGSTSITGDNEANFTLTNIPIGQSQFSIDVEIPQNYSGGSTYSNQAFLNNLPSLLAPYKASDDPDTPDVDDPTPVVISCDPLLVDLGPDQTVCETSPTTITANVSGGYGSMTYAWDNGLSAVNEHTVNPLTTTSYNVTVTDENGCSNTDVITLTIDTPPVVTLNLTTTDLCEDATSITLDGQSPVGGTFSGNGVSGSTFNPVVAGPGTHAISYTYTNASGCSGTATDYIVVNQAPTIILSDSTLCQTESIVLSPDVCEFYESLNLIRPLQNTGWDNNYSTSISELTGDGELCLTLSSSSDQSDQVFGLNDNPSSSDDYIDIDFAIQITIRPDLNLYTLQIRENGIVVSTPYSSTSSFVGSEFCIRRTGTTIEYLMDNSVVYTSLVNSNTSLYYDQSIYSDTGVWDGGTSEFSNINLCANATSLSLAYLWSTGATTPTLNLTSSSTSSLTVTDASGCTSEITQTTTINDTTVIFCQQYRIRENGTWGSWTTFSGDCTIELCEGDGLSDIQFDGGPNLNTGWVWTDEDGNIDSEVDERVVFPNLTQDDSGTYTGQYTDANGCTSTLYFEVIVGGNITVDLGADGNICLGDSIDLNAQVTGGQGNLTYQWDNGLSSVSTHRVSPSVTTTYNVTVTESNTCTSTDQITISVAGFTGAGISVNDSISCSVSTVTLDASPSGMNYQWSGPNSFTSNAEDPMVSDFGWYYLTITDPVSSCTVEDSVEVILESSMIIDSIVMNCSNNYISVYYTALGVITEGWLGIFDPAASNSSYHIWSWLPTVPGSGVVTFQSHTFGNGTYEARIFSGTEFEICDTETFSYAEVPVIDVGPDHFVCVQDLPLSFGPADNPTYTYQWSTGGSNIVGETSSTITVSPNTTTTYVLTASDSNGCTTSDEVVVDITTMIESISMVSENTCEGACDGSMSVDVDFISSGPFTISYTYESTVYNLGPYSTNDPVLIENLCAGTYSDITISNSGATCVELWSGGNLVITETGAEWEHVNIDENISSCDGTCDGSIIVDANHALTGDFYVSYTFEETTTQLGPYSHAGDITIDNLCAGTYTDITITGVDSGCSEIWPDSIQLLQPLPEALIITEVDDDCQTSEGSVTINITEGMAPYTIYWSTPDGSHSGSETLNLAGDVTITQLIGGNTYCITVTDTNGCSTN